MRNMRLTDSRVAAIKPPEEGQEEHPDDLVTGLRLRVGAGGRKAWIVRTRAGAKVVNKTLGSYPILSLSKAREMAKNFLIEIAVEGTPRVERTFGELTAEWIKKVAKPNNKSWRLQERRLEIHVLPTWKDRSISSIRRGDVRDLIDGIEGAVAPNSALRIIRTLFRYALARDWIDASPAEAIPKPKAETSRDRVLDMDEVKRVYLAADLLGYPFGGWLKLLLLTAQRRSEVAEMRWKDIDLEKGLWTIHAADNKSGRAHLVPLSPTAVAVLSATPRLGNHVWTSNGSSPISGFANAKAAIDRFVAASGPTPAPWVIHDLRRTVATHLVRIGVPETVVGRVLNHAAQGVTAKVYALHSYAPEKRAALDRWDAELQRALAGKSTDSVFQMGGGQCRTR